LDLVAHRLELLFTKQQIIEIFGVSESTIEKYLASHSEELSANGYKVLRGQRLREFKALMDVSVTDYGNKAPTLGVFTFRAMLNLAMVLVESDLARTIRSRILDIVIDVIAERSGGQTKYVNQRDGNYLPSAYQEFSYRKTFTDVLDAHLNMGKVKYGFYTNRIYQIVFLEKAEEYKQILSQRRCATKSNPHPPAPSPKAGEGGQEQFKVPLPLLGEGFRVRGFAKVAHCLSQRKSKSAMHQNVSYGIHSGYDRNSPN
jgi:hypothetical protein